MNKGIETETKRYLLRVQYGKLEVLINMQSIRQFFSIDFVFLRE